MRKTLCADDSCFFRSSEVKDNVLFSRRGTPKVLAAKIESKWLQRKKSPFYNNFLPRRTRTLSFMPEKHQSHFQSDIFRKLKGPKLNPQKLVFFELSNIPEKLNFLAIKLTFFK